MKDTRKRDRATRVSTDWDLIKKCLENQEVRTVYIHGEPGLGKTYAAFNYGRDKDEIFAITLTEDTPAAELRGHYVPVEGRLEWRDGPFTAAMRTGGRLVINEVTHAPPEVHSLLHPVLESIETAQLTLPTNETIRPAEGFQVICTDNLGPEDLSDALNDRFDCTFAVTEPHPDAFLALPDDLRDAARRSFALEKGRRVTIRRWLAISRLRKSVGMQDACRAVLGRSRGDQIVDALKLGGV